MGDLLTLARRMRKLEKDLPVNVSKLTVDTAAKVVDGLVEHPPEGTPVDTSQALSNWQAGVSRKPNNFIGPHVPGEGGSTQAVSAGRTRAAARAAMAMRKAGQVIYLSNVAPYIRRLAYEGHSAQSPPGWVEGAVLRARKWLQQQRGRLLK